MRSQALWFVILVTAGGCGGLRGGSDPGSPTPDAAEGLDGADGGTEEAVVEVSERDGPARP